MIPSRRIANLLSKQISTLAVAPQEVYGYGTELENCKFAEQANQSLLVCKSTIERIDTAEEDANSWIDEAWQKKM